jgi:hypothetical protein
LAGQYITTGSLNVALGSEALQSNTVGNNNIAIGVGAMISNKSGYSNVAIGRHALNKSTVASNLVAIGDSALYNQGVNSSGYYSNTAIGSKTLFTNTTGYSNTATGYQALYANSTGNNNVANGIYALFMNQGGYNNTASGSQAMMLNTSGFGNTAYGFQSLLGTTVGWYNTAMGSGALVTNATGSYNTALGYNTGPNAGALQNTTTIGTDATATASDMVRIGNVHVNSIGGQVGWTTLSDGRFKEGLARDVPGLAFITKLKPVTYTVNRQMVEEFTGVAARRAGLSKENPAQNAIPPAASKPARITGFVAQEVELVANAIGFDFSGIDKPKNSKDLYGLRYSEFVVPLVKAVQEQQAMIEVLQARLEQLEKLLLQKQ